MTKRILPLFLAGAVFISGIPIPAFAAGILEGETDVTADDGLLSPCTENQDVRAHEKLRDFMNKYVEPEYFLKDDNPEYQIWTRKTTKKQLQILKKAAEKATANAKTQYDKIKAITYFVAERTYYDRVSTVAEWYTDPYEVYKYKRAVCGGFSILMVTLCKAVDIPCMVLNGDNHSYNAIYDSDNKKWIFVDASACTQNYYNSGNQWVKQPPDLSKMFDMTVKQMAAYWAPSHMVMGGVAGIVDKKNDCAYYVLKTGNTYEEWLNIDNWHLSLSGAKKKNIKVSSQIGGYPICGNLVWGGSHMQGELMWESYKPETVQILDLSKTKISSIGWGAFSGNKNLKKILFPSGLDKINKYELEGCDNLETVDLSNTNLTVIEDSAFARCKKLKSVDLSNTKLKKIMYFAFQNCYALRTIKLPTTLKTIANQAFCTTDRSKKYPLTVITNLPKKKLKLSNTGIWDKRKVKVCGAYTIQFNGNGAKSGTMPKLLCGRDIKTALTGNKFKRPGYKFIGWSMKKSGKGKIYKNKGKVKNLTKKNKTVRLYAVWKKL